MGRIKSTTQSILINFDLNRAFERVDGSRIVQKLIDWHIHPSLANTIRMIINRRQFKTEVRRGNFKASPKPNAANRGAPQGSSLGPLLFVADINELIIILQERKIKVVLYAGDIALVYNFSSNADVSILRDTIQDGINTAVNWRTTNSHKVNMENVHLFTSIHLSRTKWNLISRLGAKFRNKWRK